MTKKKKIIITLIAAILLIATFVSIGMSGILDQYEKQIKLGYKLLSEGAYEEAILAFDKAIEINQKRTEAYIGKADVYVTRCDDNTLEDTENVLEIGYNQHYDDESIIMALIRLSGELFDKGQQSWAIDLLDFGYELTNDERLREYKFQLLNGVAEPILADLYNMFVNNEEDAIKQEIQSDKYIEFMSFVDDEDYKSIYFPEPTEEQSGKGIALYYVRSSNFGNIFVYYGDFLNSMRTGTGTWVGALNNRFYWFTGEWSNDYPNGYGEVREWHEGLEAGMTIRNLKGNLVNGLWNGNMNWNFVYSDQTNEHVLTFTNGHGKIIDIDVEEHEEKPYLVGADESGEDGLWFGLDPAQYTYGIVGFDDYGK